MARKLPLDIIENVARVLAEGKSVRETSRVTGINRVYVAQVRKWMDEGKVEVKDGEVVIHDEGIVRFGEREGGGGGRGDERLWWTDVKSTKPLLTSIAEKVGWFQDVIYDIGTMSIFASLMVSGVETPQEAMKIMRSFRDKEALEGYISRWLVSLFEARKDAAKIMELEEDLKFERAKRAMAEYVAQRFRQERDDLITDNRILISLLNREQMQKYYNTKIFSGLSQVAIAPKKEVEKT